MYIYLDDSERDVWVTALVITQDQKRMKKVMKRAKRARLARKERLLSEVKASHATDTFREYFYTQLSKLKQLQLSCIYLDKKKIPKHLKNEKGLVYLRMVIALLERTGIAAHKEVYLNIDEKPLQGMTKQAFIVALKSHFVGSFKHPTRFEVFFRNSHEDEGIQVADFISYAFFVKYQYGKTKWYDLVKSLVIHEIEATKVL